MGNSICGNEHFTNHVTLGRYAAIDMTKEEVETEGGGGYRQKCTLSYTIFESRCTLYLDKFMDVNGRVREIFLKLEEETAYFSGGIHIKIERAQTNFLEVRYACIESYNNGRQSSILKSNETTNAQGNVVMTTVFSYGRRGKWGLVVVERKKKSRDDEYPYKATVAHYYAISRGNIFSQNKIDIGLSMVMNIRASNNNLDFTVDGLVRHPYPALFFMLAQVSSSGNWNPMACPHCANTQRQRSGMYGQSDSEESINSGHVTNGGGIWENYGNIINNIY